MLGVRVLVAAEGRARQNIAKKGEKWVLEVRPESGYIWKAYK